MTLTLFLLALGVSSSTPQIVDAPEPAESYRIVSRGFGPVGSVRVTRPTFSWSVAPQNGARVTGTTITINGNTVPAMYDAERSEVLYTPAASLKRGEYKVQVQVEVASAVRFKKEWTTTVPANAVDRLPPPHQKQVEVFQILNAQREAMGLQAFSLDDALCAAAESHALYLAENAAIGHVQSEGTKGFSGAQPWDRTRAFGFSGGTWEAAGYEVAEPVAAFAAIFDAPYHRVPFLQPGTARVGIGTSKRGTVIDGEVPHGKGTIVSPGSGQTGVPTSWRGYERPDPLRHWPELQRPTGYPIVLADFADEGGKVAVGSAKLTLDGKAIKTYLVTPAIDEHLSNAAILIPARPLGKGKTYTVEMTASRDGRDLSRRWSFTTAE